VRSSLRQSWLIYALGAGWGHLQRTLSLARVASKSHNIRILTNSPYVHRISSDAELIYLQPDLPITQARLESAAVVDRSDYDCLIVDTFPCGLGGELRAKLPGLPVTKVLVHRELTPEYVQSYDLQCFVSSVFDQVLVPGPYESASFSNRFTTPAWLIREHCELLGPKVARRVLKVDDRPLVLVLARGMQTELEWYSETTKLLAANLPGIALRCISAERPPDCPIELWIDHWPAMELLPQATAAVGSGGYNTIYECKACGVPLVARAWSRKYDRQHLRATKAAAYSVVSSSEALDAVRLLLNETRNSASGHFVNGAHAAVDMITSAVRERGRKLKRH
jgi:UDP:flavonoid glycosyltransferase YjiC (YdhE family)